VSDHSVAERPSISIDTAAIRLTDTILGYNEEDLADTLKAIAAAIGVAHISYIRFTSDKSSDTSMLTAALTYSREWQLRYFFKEYIKVDPVVAHGRHAVLPFDWRPCSAATPP
jgi:Autoinducer binding domain